MLDRNTVKFNQTSLFLFPLENRIHVVHKIKKNAYL